MTETTVTTAPILSREVSEGGLFKLEGVIAKLAKRAARLGLPPFSIEKGEPIVHRKTNPDTGFEKVWKTIPVTIHGPELRIPGFTLAARIEHTEAGNLVLANPKVEGVDFTAYRTVEPACDHCGVKRNRKDTFLVLETESNALKHVGSDCIRDFLGHGSPEVVLFVSSILHTLDGALDEDDWGGGGGGGRSPYYDLPDFLAAVVWCAREYGWHPKTADCPTACSAETLLHGIITPGRAGEELRAARAKFHADKAADPTIVETAEKCVEWALAIPDNTTNDYLWNLKVLAGAGYFHYRRVNLAAAMVKSFLKLEAERREVATKLNVHLGEVGKREVFANVKIVGSYGFTSDTWGDGIIWAFETAEGASLKWFSFGATREWAKLHESGETFSIKGTVKSHGEYKGRKETALGRVALFVPKPPKVKKPRKAKVIEPATLVG